MHYDIVIQEAMAEKAQMTRIILQGLVLHRGSISVLQVRVLCEVLGLGMEILLGLCALTL